MPTADTSTTAPHETTRPVTAFETPAYARAAYAVPAPRNARYAWATLRLALAWIFLWAFLDKTFGLGFSTAREAAWIHGGSPTTGFLTFGTQGPFAGTFQSLAGSPLIDALFMLGLLAIGTALLLGIGLRLAALGGTAMLLLMWLASPPTTNPVVDDHIVYAIALWALALTSAGNTLGLGARWSGLPMVQRTPLLR